MRNLYKNHRKKGFYTNSLLRFKISCKREYIPVGCVLSTTVAVSPAMHAPCHTCPPGMHASLPHIPQPHTPPLFAKDAPLHHTCPLHYACLPISPHMPPFTTHAPLHYACLPLSPHMAPFTMHAAPPPTPHPPNISTPSPQFSKFLSQNQVWLDTLLVNILVSCCVDLGHILCNLDWRYCQDWALVNKKVRDMTLSALCFLFLKCMTTWNIYWS